MLVTISYRKRCQIFGLANQRNNFTILYSNIKIKDFTGLNESIEFNIMSGLEGEISIPSFKRELSCYNCCRTNLIAY